MGTLLASGNKHTFPRGASRAFTLVGIDSQGASCSSRREATAEAAGCLGPEKAPRASGADRLVNGPHCVSHSCPTATQWLWRASGTIRHRLVLDFRIKLGAE
jgi:hypothetical protein